MQLRVNLYKWGVIAVGLVFSVWGIVHAILNFALESPASYIQQTLFLIAICAACRSLPISLGRDKTLDLSVISILMVFLTMGVWQAVTVFALSTLVTFVYLDDGREKRVTSLYNTPLDKSLFNLASVVIAIVIPGLLCQLLNWTVGEFVYPQVLLVTVVFSIGTYLVNTAIMLALFSMLDGLNRYEVIHTFIGLIPNVLPALPLGFVMAIFYRLEKGMLLVLLLFCPLLLARHAWKLYIDSLNQQQKLVDALNAAMEARDPYTSGHAKRVGDYAAIIAQEMGMGPGEILLLQRGAMLHDIGKVGVSDTILLKPGKLTQEERERIEQHPVIGANITEHVQFENPITDMVRHHHERFDGNGYPDRLAGEMISKNARILAVADTLDALRTERPYRKGIALERSLEIIREVSGAQLDPAVVEALLRAKERLG